ncbi:MAG: hypothetical protein HY650_12335 [Acidobacteria bacterium]|nr:hypothetical protein [Acidobacteriota bacterium]
MKFIQREQLRAWKMTLHREGFRGFIRTYGKRILFWFFLFYLVRDTLLYIVIPYLIAKGLLSTFPQLEKLLP